MTDELYQKAAARWQEREALYETYANACWRIRAMAQVNEVTEAKLRSLEQAFQEEHQLRFGMTIDALQAWIEHRTDLLAE